MAILPDNDEFGFLLDCNRQSAFWASADDGVFIETADACFSFDNGQAFFDAGSNRYFLFSSMRRCRIFSAGVMKGRLKTTMRFQTAFHD
ncbi:hypothetical protein C7N83_12560 [Neisseria iguanae]|uniref:Uncharacterized protein n=1 Tax=Neisseria iguanae TaxID=90242 RepID=A0A2P7TXE1_9NEIS|nr:hypothetical protein C7N83_12560 [Neisseria iguanae]